MSKKYDQIFRENLQEIFPQVLAAFNDTEYRQAKPLPTTMVKTLQREPDFLFEVQTDKGKQILHVDVQTKHDPAMHRRMYLYSALLFDKYQLPVKQVVLYIGGGKQPMPDTVAMADFTYSYQLIDFRQIPYRSLLASKDPSKVLFAILCDFGTDTKEKAATAIVNRLRQTAKHDTSVFGHLQVLADLRNLGAFIKQLEKKMALEIKDRETSLYKLGSKEKSEQIVRNMLIKGIAPATIAELTGLSLAEVKKLVGK
ncbi:MAG: hypothetical protein MUD08_09530 [Cytophagales bacterium]|jgi:hypothetical protein|nr:hypothetical protein [Cytophagales bacterium]